MRRIKNTTGKVLLVCDLKREHRAIRGEVAHAVRRVLDSGWYILGKELESFEREFAVYNGAHHAVGVASGTEAIQLALTSLGVGRGDEVITPVNTAIPTAMAIAACGAMPRFVDVDDATSNIDVSRLEQAITKKTRAIVPVHLYGRACNIEEIMKIANRHGCSVVEDCAQAQGAMRAKKKVGNFGALGAFSFYPTKNLGCYGDGGIVATSDKRLADKLRLLRNYGQSSRYRCEVQGINSRLDEIQAAILRVKLRHLAGWTSRRQRLSGVYSENLRNIDGVITPLIGKAAEHVFHLYVIRCRRRDELKEYLADRGIETQIHYPIPLHLQKAFKGLRYRRGDFPVAERLSGEILSLPIFPSLTDREVLAVCESIRLFYKRHR